MDSDPGSILSKSFLSCTYKNICVMPQKNYLEGFCYDYILATRKWPLS